MGRYGRLLCLLGLLVAAVIGLIEFERRMSLNG